MIMKNRKKILSLITYQELIRKMPLIGVSSKIRPKTTLPNRGSLPELILLSLRILRSKL